jgi:hypothetical protein
VLVLRSELTPRDLRRPDGQSLRYTEPHPVRGLPITA